jgi:hypothetical protein
LARNELSLREAPIEWQALRLTVSDALAVWASKKLRNDELLIPSFAATRLKMELDRIPLWRGDHVAVKRLVQDFAQYLYLPRLVHTGGGGTSRRPPPRQASSVPGGRQG